MGRCILIVAERPEVVSDIVPAWGLYWVGVSLAFLSGILVTVLGRKKSRARGAALVEIEVDAEAG